MLASALALAGCGDKRARDPEPLTFEERLDTTGLTRGVLLLTAVEPYRMPNGALRVRGTLDFPDGARLQISIHRRPTGEMVGRVHVYVNHGRFDSPPILGPAGPLPRADYRFEFVTHFTDLWQTPDVLRRTRQGYRLRGPGITRDRMGQVSFLLTRDVTL